MAAKGFRASYFKSLGYSAAQISELRAKYIYNQRLQAAILSAITQDQLRRAALQVQQQLIRHLMSGLEAMWSATQANLREQIDQLIPPAAKAEGIKLNVKAARDIKRLVTVQFTSGRTATDVLVSNTEKAMEHNIALLFRDNSRVYSDLSRMRYANLVIGQEIRAELPKIVPQIMLQAFMSSWKTLTFIQFPEAYRILIINVIATKLLVNVMGQSATSWLAKIDFNELFGGLIELEQGYHYGALLAEDTDGTLRATLPHPESEDLKNPVWIRYKYWSQMWKGQRFYSSFGARTRPYHFKKTRMEAQERYAKSVRSLAEYMRKNATQDRSGAWQASTDATEKIRKRQEGLKKMSVSIHKMDTNQQLPPLEIPKGQREETIAARAVYWSQRRLAPVWVLLQYGQVRYAPMIPPMGVFEKFRTLLNAYLEEEIMRRYNTEFAKLQHVTTTGAIIGGRATTGVGGWVIPEDRPIAMPLPLGITEANRKTPAADNKMYTMLPKARSAISKALENIYAAKATKYYSTISPEAAAKEVMAILRSLPTEEQTPRVAENLAYHMYGGPSMATSMANPTYVNRLRSGMPQYLNLGPENLSVSETGYSTFPSNINFDTRQVIMRETVLARRASKVVRRRKNPTS